MCCFLLFVEPEVVHGNTLRQTGRTLGGVIRSPCFHEADLVCFAGTSTFCGGVHLAVVPEVGGIQGGRRREGRKGGREE